MNSSQILNALRINKPDSDVLIEQYGKWNNKLGSFRRMPSIYFFYITDICNLDCHYCWQRAAKSTPNPISELNLEEWIQIVDNLPKFSFVGLSGGEATVFPEIKELVKKIKANSHPMSLNTNGILLEEDKLMAFVESGMDNISISVDGFAKNFDKARGYEGLFDRIERNVKRLNRIKKEMGTNKPTLTIKTVLLDECVDELDDLYDYVTNELLAENLNISFMKTSDHVQMDTRILQEWQQVLDKGKPVLHAYENREKIVHTLLRLLEKSKGSKCTVSLYPKMKTEKEIRYFLENDGVNVYQPCHVPWAMSIVSPVGDVIPCLSLNMGNLREHKYNIKKIYYSQKYNEFLNWLDKLNDAKNTGSPCNMCCFLRVKEN
ncbi:MAG: radical SAM protein [Nitrospinae bacterium]|nr:radical SAM protein [Nitrospinota bacterium]